MNDSCANINFHSRHHEIFRGRKVALVGPSQTLLGRGQGHIIDDFDVVVRLNTAIEYFPFEADMVSDIGKRLDVLYASIGHMRTWLKTINFPSPFATEGFPLRQVCCDHKVKEVVVANSTSNVKEEWLSEWRQLMSPVQVSSVNDGVGLWIRDQLFSDPHLPTSGLAALIDIAYAEPAELFIYGMTFYNDFSNIFRHEKDNNMVDKKFFLNANHHWGTELEAVARFVNMGLINVKADAVLSGYLETVHD